MLESAENLRKLKCALRFWNKDYFGNVHNKVIEAKGCLADIHQRLLDEGLPSYPYDLERVSLA